MTLLTWKIPLGIPYKLGGGNRFDYQLLPAHQRMGALRAASGENEPSSPTLGKLAMNRKVRGKERQTRKKAAFGGHKPSGLDNHLRASLSFKAGQKKDLNQTKLLFTDSLPIVELFEFHSKPSRFKSSRILLEENRVLIAY
ncbi:hypothetical protein CMV_024249 [Castanea mollissima]|uniref:Uncharacterized protein n=1 Tax=Castanea mollissima TaxID=60419 RepID=A0A8J4QEL6_9ROSI|nr:hypothetical protein CMV_024249 [Castanea mollissima]